MVTLKSHELLQILSKFLPNKEEITSHITFVLIKGATLPNLRLIRKLGETPGQTFFFSKVFKHLHPRQPKVAITYRLPL